MVSRYDYTERELRRTRTFILGRWYMDLQVGLAYNSVKKEERPAMISQLELIAAVLRGRQFQNRLALRDLLEELFEVCIPMQAKEKRRIWGRILMDYQRDILD